MVVGLPGLIYSSLKRYPFKLKFPGILLFFVSVVGVVGLCVGQKKQDFHSKLPTFVFCQDFLEATGDAHKRRHLAMLGETTRIPSLGCPNVLLPKKKYHNIHIYVYTISYNYQQKHVCFVICILYANIFPYILRDRYRYLSRFSKPPTESCGPEAPFVAKAGTVLGTLGASGG